MRKTAGAAFGRPGPCIIRDWALEADHAEKDHHRRYQVTVGRDPLDDWTVAIHSGRTGRAGRESRYADPQPEGLRAIIRDRLRRLSAPRRIGCPYQLATLHATDGFDAAAWLPGVSSIGPGNFCF